MLYGIALGLNGYQKHYNKTKMDEITKILYWISTGLLIPVIILLLFFFIRALITIGTFYSMYIQKLKFNKVMRPIFESLEINTVRDNLATNEISGKLISSLYLQKLLKVTPSAIHYNKVLSDFEMSCQKDLANSQTLAKLGPILGLMGTLIPMGPALVGLASGDISSMATNMQVAFATTVIGLLIGAVGFIVLQMKKRWYAADVSDMEFVANLLEENDKLSSNKAE